MKRLLALLLMSLVGASLAFAEEKPTEAPNNQPAETDRAEKPADKDDAKPIDPEKVDWSKVDWRKRLTRLQYYVTRQAGTERAFHNAYWDFFKRGQYRCVGCGLPLFDSEAKFDSHCGWPSFDQTIGKNVVTQHADYKLFQPRVEIRCRRCKAHLGHVFKDGPTETGLRYCMNSAAMKFVSEKQLDKEKDKSKVAGDDKSKKSETKAESEAEATAEPAKDAPSK